MCVKPGTARFAARKTIKYYPLSPYAKRLPFGPAIPSGCTRGAVLCPRSVSYTSSTERMTQGPPRFCLRLLPAESARFLIENACDFCTEIARFIVFLHEIACFPHVPGVLFLHICTHKDLAAPRVGLSWSRSVFRRHCLCMVYGRCGGLYRVQRRHVRGLAARAVRLNDRGADQRYSAGPAVGAVILYVADAERWKPVQGLRCFQSWRCSVFGRSSKFGAVPCDCGTMAVLCPPRAGRPGCLPQRPGNGSTG